MKYNVEVSEVLSRIITVEAPTADEAEQRVRLAYNDEEIVLDSADVMGEATIEVSEDSVPDDFPTDYTVKATND